jgi:hypothetical protein
VRSDVHARGHSDNLPAAVRVSFATGVSRSVSDARSDCYSRAGVVLFLNVCRQCVGLAAPDRATPHERARRKRAHSGGGTTPGRPCGSDRRRSSRGLPIRRRRRQERVLIVDAVVAGKGAQG